MDTLIDNVLEDNVWIHIPELSTDNKISSILFQNISKPKVDDNARVILIKTFTQIYWIKLLIVNRNTYFIERCEKCELIFSIQIGWEQDTNPRIVTKNNCKL